MGTLTDLLGLYKPDNGETGWGDEVDANFDVLESRITSEHTNVRDYGALGDGITDDTDACQAAIDAAAGGTCFFPAGTYFLADGSSLQWRDCYNLVGVNPSATIISSKNAYAIIQGTTGTGGMLMNIGTTLRSGATSGGGLSLAGGDGMLLWNVSAGGVLTSTDPGLEVTTNLIGCIFYKCRAAVWGGRGISITPSSFNNANMYRDCTIGQTLGAGVYWTGGHGNVWDGGILEGSGGFLLDDTARAVIRNVWFEGNGGSPIQLSGTVAQPTIEQNSFFYTQSTAGLNHIDGAAATSLSYLVIRGNHFIDPPGTGAPTDYYIDLGSNSPSVLLDSNSGLTAVGVNAASAAITWLNDSNGNPFVAGKVSIPLGGGVLLTEGSDPSAPSTNNAIIYAKDNGGKTQIVARFPTGALQVIATEP